MEKIEFEFFLTVSGFRSCVLHLYEREPKPEILDVAQEFARKGVTVKQLFRSYEKAFPSERTNEEAAMFRRAIEAVTYLWPSDVPLAEIEARQRLYVDGSVPSLECFSDPHWIAFVTHFLKVITHPSASN